MLNSKFCWLLVWLSFGASAQGLLRRVVVDAKTYRLSADSTIRIKANENDLVLDFEGLTNDSTLYFYRLTPLQTAWSQSFYPTAHYLNMSGGNYTFEFYAKTNKHQTQTLRLAVDVQQSFWQRWWFLPSVAVYVLLLIGIVTYFFFLYNFRQKLKLHHTRNQIASDLHDEVGSNLNSIAIFVELLRKKANQDPALLPILDKITTNSEESVMLMRDTVWAINPNNDSTEKLLEKMRSFGVEMLSAKNIPLDFEHQIDITKINLSMEQRRNLYLIYKEAINNIAKHAQATKANVELRITNDALRVMIIDNGRGFDPDQTFEGNGLKNYKLRSQEHDIEVGVTSEVGIGTKIMITLAV